MSLLAVKNLNIAFRNGKKIVPVVSGVSFQVEKGEILALVGESGCGKSISALALTGLLPNAEVSADSISFEDGDIRDIAPRNMRKIRGGGIGYIFQEPAASLNPVFRVGAQIAEAVELHRPEIADVEQEVVALLTKVGIPAPAERMNSFPHELSGGMQQRIMIAMALAGAPRLLIADEPTTALDVTIQAQILELIDAMRRSSSMGVLLITHNLGIVAELADRVAVMYAGNIVESGRTADVIADPRHPYTKALLAAVPRRGSAAGRLSTIPGSVPTPDKFPSGCRFCGRCSLAAAAGAAELEICRSKPVPEKCDATGRMWRCRLVSDAGVRQ